MYESFNLIKLYKNYSSSNYNPNRGYINHINLPKIKWINKAINLLPDYDSFIDIGACNSEFSWLLFKKGFVKGCAVEINPTTELINFSRQKSNFKLFQGLLQDFSEYKECGFFILSEIFEHIPPVDMKSFIQKIENMALKNSIIFLSTPDPIFCGPASLSDIFYVKSRYGHYKHYHKNEIIEYFKNFDLVIYSKIESGSLVKFSDKIISFKRRTKKGPFFLKVLFNSIFNLLFLLFMKTEKFRENKRTQILVFKRK